MVHCNKAIWWLWNRTYIFTLVLNLITTQKYENNNKYDNQTATIHTRNANTNKTKKKNGNYDYNLNEYEYAKNSITKNW